MNDPQAGMSAVAARLNLEAPDIPSILEKLKELHEGKNCIETDLIPQKDWKALLLDSNCTYRTTLMSKSHNTSGGHTRKYITEMPTRLFIEQ